jgi:acyl-coenzyme A synthetase/AMP-(fatty) acid ligase
MQMRISEKGHLEMRKAPSNPWADTGDLVESKEDRVLFRGRADGMINVGGVKVSPESVERVILAIPGVAMAMAVPRASSMIGQVIEALVVPQISDDQEFGDLHETVIAACHRHLEPAEVPAIVRLVKELPMTGAGKVDRRSPRQSSAKEA